MTPSANTFLAELYAIDPTLKAHEADLLPLIEALLASDPSLAPDQDFVAALRVSLREHAATLSGAPKKSSSLWNALIFGLSGAATAAVVLGLAVVMTQQQPLGGTTDQTAKTTSSAPALFAMHVEPAGSERAFGTLTADQAPAGVAPGAFGGIGGGGGGVAMAQPRSGGGGPGAMPIMATPPLPVDAKMMPPYQVTQYKYVFSGSLAGLLQPKVTVYERTPEKNLLPMSTVASSLKIGLLDLASFKNAQIQNITFGQNVPFGYSMTLNLQEAMLSIDAQWDQWPMATCTTADCYQPLTIKDVPTDAELLKIATTFAADHGFDLSHYGQPEIDQTWRLSYDQAEDKANAYVPDTIRIVYPLLVEKLPTYDQAGQKNGISLNISLRYKRVMGVWGINGQTYQSSQYDGVTESGDVLKYIDMIDNYGGYPMPLRGDGSGDQPSAQTVTVTLGTPVAGLSQLFNYQANANHELLVPSLIFPVVRTEGANMPFWRTQIVVPLAKDLQIGVFPMFKAADGIVAPVAEPAPEPEAKPSGMMPLRTE